MYISITSLSLYIYMYMYIRIYMYIRRPLPKLERVRLHVQSTNCFQSCTAKSAITAIPCHLPSCSLQSSDTAQRRFLYNRLVALSYRGRTPPPQSATGCHKAPCGTMLASRWECQDVWPEPEPCTYVMRSWARACIWRRTRNCRFKCQFCNKSVLCTGI